MFTQFATETSFDALRMWDGPTTGSPKIASANGAPGGEQLLGTGGLRSSANNPVAAPSNVAPGTVRATAANALWCADLRLRVDGSAVRRLTAQVSEFIPVTRYRTLSTWLSVLTRAPARHGYPERTNVQPRWLRHVAGYTVCHALDADPHTCLSQPYPAQVVVSGIPSGMPHHYLAGAQRLRFCIG